MDDERLSLTSAESDFSDDYFEGPDCPESLQPGALLVQYKLDRGPAIDDEMWDVYDKLSAMGDIFYRCHEEDEITYEFLSKNEIYRDRVMNPFRQKIGPCSFNRSHIDPVAFLKREESTFMVVYMPLREIFDKRGGPKPPKRIRDPSSSNDEASISQTKKAAQPDKHSPKDGKTSSQSNRDLRHITPRKHSLHRQITPFPAQNS